MDKRLIVEIIRAKMFSTRKWVGAEVHDTGKKDYGEPKTKKVRIADIKASWEGFDKAHHRHGGEEPRKNVERIKKALRHKDRDKVPPMLVRRNPKGVGYEIVDGNHRYHAHLEVGNKEVPVKELPPFMARGRRFRRFTGARKKGLKLYGPSEKPEFLQKNPPYKHYLDSKKLKRLGLKEFIQRRDEILEGNKLWKNIEEPLKQGKKLGIVSADRGHRIGIAKKLARQGLKNDLRRLLKKKAISGFHSAHGLYQYAEPEAGNSGVSKEKSFVVRQGKGKHFDKIMKALGNRYDQESIMRIRPDKNADWKYLKTSNTPGKVDKKGKVVYNRKMETGEGKTSFKKNQSFTTTGE